MDSQYILGEVMISEREIAERVRSMAEQIASDSREGRELIMAGILNGAAIFLSDLARHMPSGMNVKIDFMAVSSYGESTKSSGAVRIVKDLSSDIEGKDLLIVEDIIDTGLTLSYLLELMQARRPAALHTCVLLDKYERREKAVDVDYCGFRIPDAFVVGYGLDYSGKWRHLPSIHVVNKL